ncbi:hypothetical protein JCM9957A_20600 [Kineosporia succinea]
MRRPWVHVPTRGLQGLAVLGLGLVVACGTLVGGVQGVRAAASALGADDSSTAVAGPAPVGGKGTPGVSATAGVSAAPGSPAPGKNGPAGSSQLQPVPAGDNRTAPAPAGGGGQTGSGQSAQGQKPQSQNTQAQNPQGQNAQDDATSGQSTQSQSSSTQPAAAAARTSTTTAAGPVYKTVGVIRNLMTHYCADLPGRTGSVAENALVAQYTCDGSTNDNQVYQTVTQADGTFLLRNLRSGWCLDVNGGGAVAKGTVVNTHKCLLGSSDNQMFRKEAHGSGFFLVNVKSNLCLNVSNPDGVDNKVLGMRLTLFPCSTNDDHIWVFG